MKTKIYKFEDIDPQIARLRDYYAVVVWDQPYSFPKIYVYDPRLPGPFLMMTYCRSLDYFLRRHPVEVSWRDVPELNPLEILIEYGVNVK